MPRSDKLFAHEYNILVLTPNVLVAWRKTRSFPTNTCLVGRKLLHNLTIRMRVSCLEEHLAFFFNCRQNTLYSRGTQLTN